MGTSPKWPRWRAAPHLGQGPAAHPAPARPSPHQPVPGGLPDPADVVYVLLFHSRIHCGERGKGVTGSGGPCPMVGGHRPSLAKAAGQRHLSVSATDGLEPL